MVPGLSVGDMLWEIWFLVLVLGAGIFFVARLRFGPRYAQREEKRWLHTYTTRKLSPTEEEGRERLVKVKDLEAEARQKARTQVPVVAPPVSKNTPPPPPPRGKK